MLALLVHFMILCFVLSVPAKAWAQSQGRLFGGKSVAQIRRKLYYMLKVKSREF